MKQIDSKIYDKDYYLNICLGSEGFKKSKGKRLNEKWEKILNLVEIKPGMKVLDLGCGRGDAVFYLAKKGAEVVGIDYSKDAIDLANQALIKMPDKIKKLTSFIQIDAKKIEFNENYFDLIISFDVFEHLYRKEIEIVMNKLSKIIKRNGILLVHTETNKIFLDYTHSFYIYPLSTLLLTMNKLIFKKDYPGLPRDLRNEFHKAQHINEPNIFYLKKLFKAHEFEGKIIQSVGILKPVFKWKDVLYNLTVCLYPFSKLFPLNIFFATDYICVMRNYKK